MKNYEITFIVRPDLEEANIKAVADSMKDLLVKNGATVKEEKALGQKELAYEINKYKTGYYFFYAVSTNDTKAIDEFSRLARINENIIRDLVVRVED